MGTQESILDLLTEVNAKVNDMVQEYGFSQITVLESTLNKKLVFDKVSIAGKNDNTLYRFEVNESLKS